MNHRFEIVVSLRGKLVSLPNVKNKCSLIVNVK